MNQQACYHCGHAQPDHNGIQGCPYCKCMATRGEAGKDPSGEYADLRVRRPEEPPLYDWQRPEPEQQEIPERYVVTTPKGFTETFSASDIDVLVRLGLIRHDYDGHVLTDGQGNGVGALHHFYREAS